MGRRAVHDWKSYLTVGERAEMARLRLRLKEMSAKIAPIKSKLRLLQNAASKRAQRDDDKSCRVSDG